MSVYKLSLLPLPRKGVIISILVLFFGLVLPTGSFESFGQEKSDKIVYNNHIAVLTQYLSNTIFDHSINEEFSLCDLDFQFLKAHKITTFKEEFVYKFGKPSGTKAKEKVFESYYNSTAKELHMGHAIIKEDKKDWIFLLNRDYSSIQQVVILKEGIGDRLEYYASDGSLLGKTIISFTNEGLINRLGQCVFTWDKGLLSSFVEGIDPGEKAYIKTAFHRFLIERKDAKIPTKLIERNGWFQHGEQAEKELIFHLDVLEISPDGYWTKIEAWIDEPTCQDGIQKMFTYYRIIE